MHTGGAMGTQTTDTGFSGLDREILKRVQGTLPDSATPFADIAAAVGTDEAHVLDLLSRMTASGQIRRFGATLKHQKAGYGANVMVAWFVPEEDVDRIGALMAERPEVSHCYHRVNCLDWPYNLYTMVHGRSAEACRAVVEALCRTTGLDDYAMLFSLKELKKVSMRYF
jgi:DNA-binding Lrp family transcriptional regulator